ncbi:single-stranded DNA-binding protein [Candidatus Mycolicibacterium alkanivorans]|uniref:Single-stranded DNA-binding protein n=1 Tax=Candidatus Mycolicibacterium alkanivorans TaxID=2954114 RepID=A0ABS9YWM5_9MYCO|nr:single-stranded DNA-binding protein [Candidatus Mycolicibacterium alkanivorans]MCI4675168.1 single-stranded DNA-binding protein [Candidatus Mycolicibacterium alkanivorans]
MFETHLTVVGRIVTDLRRKPVNGQELISFRVASNSRRRNGEGTWEPGNSLFITVNCWGKLVTGVGAALYKGAPVIVVGDVFTSEYEDKDGVRRSSLEMRATAVGPDLSRAIVRFEQPQPKAAEPVAEEAAPDEAEEPEEAADLVLSA